MVLPAARRTPSTGISTPLSVHTHRLIVAYSWNSQLLPQGDELSGLLAGIDRRRTTAVGVTGARGYDTMTTAVLDLLLCMQIFTLLFFNQFWV